MLEIIPSQEQLKNSIQNIPVEYFKWGTYPDHFKIDMPHRHQFWELLFFTQGGGIHEIDFVDHEIFSYSIHCIPKQVTHFLKRSPYSAGFTLAFDTDFFEHNQIHRFLNPLKHQPFTLNLSEVEFGFILEQTKQIQYLIRQNTSYFKDKCFLLSMELLLHSIVAQQKHLMQESEPSQELVRNFRTVVAANFQEHRKVIWYANKLNVSAKHLGNVVKKELDISPKTYILDSVLKSVKKQLLDTNKTLKDIAFYHHYDLTSLGKLFKKRVGYSMKNYRSYGYSNN